MISPTQFGGSFVSKANLQPTLSETLRQRLETLGITIVTVEVDGWVTVQGVSRWIDRLLTDSPQFAQAAREHLPDLHQRSGQEVAIWPGVWLVPLQARRHRIISKAPFTSPILAALLLGEAFLESEWFALLCDTNKIDRQSAQARVDRTALVSPVEVRRLAGILIWMQEDSLEIDRRHTELRTLSQQLGNSYEELSLLYKLSSHMNVNHSPAQFLTDACQELQQVVGLRWMSLQLTDDEPRLNGLAGQLFTAGHVGADLNLLRRMGNILLLQRHGNTHPIVVEDTETFGIPHLSKLAKQLLVVSLVRDGTPFGILFGGDKLDGSHINSADSKLCNTLGNSLSIFLENMMLYEDMQAMYMGTLHALTNSIDAKDSYTFGHSERVALLARQLARAANLPDHDIERAYIAGLVHDVGKIGVPESVLCKPGPLTDEEFSLIKRHPEIGAHILADIRQMQSVIPGVLYHHERWDGRGYPQQLAGESIPLLGRIISLADSFDAMSSNRTYRPCMDHEKILQEINRHAGVQFDPDLAKVFIQLDFSTFFSMIAQHKNLDNRQPAQPTLSQAAPALSPTPSQS